MSEESPFLHSADPIIALFCAHLDLVWWFLYHNPLFRQVGVPEERVLYKLRGGIFVDLCVPREGRANAHKLCKQMLSECIRKISLDGRMT